jgi:hypothetical protein
MTDIDIAYQAAGYLNQVSISYVEWWKRCQNPAYNKEASNWWKGLARLQSIGVPITLPATPAPAPAPAAAPTPTIDLSPAYSWILMAQEPDKALIYPPYYGIAFTADSAYPKPSTSLISQLRSRGQRVRSWCDCHSTMPPVAIKMAQDYGLDGWIGEGESAYAFDNAYAAGARIIVGNLSALRYDQQALIATGKVLWTNELYLNDDPTLATRENWMTLPVAGRTVACYHGYSFQNYLDLGKYRAHIDSFYDPGATDDDRRLVP